MSYFITRDAQDRIFLEHITPSERQKWPAVLVNGHMKRGETLPCDAGQLDGDAIINWSLDGTAMVQVPAMVPSVAQEPPRVALVDLPSREEG